MCDFHSCVIRADEYRYEAIVAASLMNGQFTQARQQCASYGLDYAEELLRHKTLTA